jgi:hypothetical protein
MAHKGKRPKGKERDDMQSWPGHYPAEVLMAPPKRKKKKPKKGKKY